jgi:beta-galactosidase
MNWFDGYDHYEMAEDLDMAAWDWYVGMGHHDFQSSGAAHDLVRGYKHRNFWLIETQPGNVNWKPINNSLDKGEARVMAWHAVGHGADAILYWQWRSPLNGQEQYHGTLVDPSGQPRPFYSEAKQLANDFSVVSDLLAGSLLAPEVALLNCYDSRWSIQWQPHHRDFNYLSHFINYYHPLAARNISMDIISADEPLEKYKLVISPALLILDDQRVAQLKSFVENGGHLVLTVRSGMKDRFNALLPLRQPGFLAEMCGVEVEDYYALLDPIPVIGDGWSGSAILWAERLKILDKSTKVLAQYGKSNGWLDNQPAITRHPYGNGVVTFIGVCLDEMNQDRILSQVIQEAGIQPVLSTPVGVEACKRITVENKEIILLINHTQTQQKVKLPWKAEEHLQNQVIGREVTLKAYDIAVITKVE